MTKNNKSKKKSWHNFPKEILHGTHAKCKICKKFVKNLEAHMKERHKEKIKFSNLLGSIPT